MFFADLPSPTSEEVFSFLKVLASFMVIVLVGLKIADHFKDKPPMERQLGALKDWINDRLNRQDDDSVARLSKLRDDIGIENSKIHDRITSHGQSLYHLKGVVDGMRGESPLMNLRKAIVFAMHSYPEFYLIHPEALFIEVANLAAVTFSMAEMLHELNAMEADKLCVSQREYNILKWRLSGAGRAWLRGA